MLPNKTRVFLMRCFEQYFQNDETLDTAIEYASRSIPQSRKRLSISSKSTSSAEARKFQRLFNNSEKPPKWDEAGVLLEARALIFERLGRSGIFIPSIAFNKAYVNDLGRIEDASSSKASNKRELGTARASCIREYSTRKQILVFANDRGAAAIHAALEFNNSWTKGSDARRRRDKAGLPIPEILKEDWFKIPARLIREAQAGSIWQQTQVMATTYSDDDRDPSWEYISPNVAYPRDEHFLVSRKYKTLEQLQFYQRIAYKANSSKLCVGSEIAAIHAETKLTWDRALALAILGQAIKLYL